MGLYSQTIGNNLTQSHPISPNPSHSRIPSAQCGGMRRNLAHCRPFYHLVSRGQQFRLDACNCTGFDRTQAASANVHSVDCGGMSFNDASSFHLLRRPTVRSDVRHVQSWSSESAMQDNLPPAITARRLRLYGIGRGWLRLFQIICDRRRLVSD